MVKVKEEPAMAEPNPAAQASNSGPLPRKQRPHPHPHHHAHAPPPPFPHYHQYCTYAADAAVDGASSSPAKFYFGPGFEPQQQGGQYGPGPSQQNGEYVVFFHVNPGVTISFQMGDNLEVLRGEWMT